MIGNFCTASAIKTKNAGIFVKNFESNHFQQLKYLSEILISCCFSGASLPQVSLDQQL